MAPKRPPQAAKGPNPAPKRSEVKDSHDRYAHSEGQAQNKTSGKANKTP